MAKSFRGVLLQRLLERHRPIEPHWYLKNIVVGEYTRNITIGTGLLAHRLEILDKTG